ncbi:Asp-tRNA(Asn)/Glu-tRNA(Gln) amidotransferase subunit GatB [Candidatus Woesearchaeota archaeon]|nr:Asp-tRNA(Asn)/Glu-tRNA(Gln) amidotransferase subunit GatB [Candidatus Woesearchaeota archaeon]
MKFKNDVVIGLEIHVELNTKTKLFCSCPTQGSEEPNTRVCPICLGHPGSKPKVNKKAIEYSAKLATALNCKIAKELIFSRKSYFYPDMSKNFQITQYEQPLGEDGFIELGKNKIRIKRVHMEEDPAALIHPGGIGIAKYVLVDYNRSGNPLCEVVTEPDLSSPEEARDFMKSLITILRYLGIFDPEKNIVKADANVSIKEKGYVRAEIKNITGFREIERALAYEIERQKHSDVKQETRSWDAEKGITSSLRTKETEEDYGYIFDPDLVPIEIDTSWLKKLKSEIPEMPEKKSKRYVKEYKIAADDAFVITNEFSLTEIFEKAVKKVDPVLAARWIRRELIRILNYNKIDPGEMKLNKEQFISLLVLLKQKKITDNTAQKVLEKLVVEDIDVQKYIAENKLEAVSDSGVIDTYCKEAIAENPKAVEDYKAGNENSLNFIVGQVMRKSKGKADARDVKERIRKIIK